MLLLVSIIFLIFVWFCLFTFTKCDVKNNKIKKKKRRRKREFFVEHIEPTAKGQIMLTDEIGNLSTFNVGTDKTLVSDGSGNITTIKTGLFNNPIIANNGINASTGTFDGSLNAKGGITSTTGTFTGGLNATTGTFDGAITTKGGMKANGAIEANGGFYGTLMMINDTRNVDSPPSFYRTKPGVITEFKVASSIGLPEGGFITLETKTPWLDNSAGLQIVQMATRGGNNVKYFRYAMPQDEKWGPWELDSDYESFSDVYTGTFFGTVNNPNAGAGWTIGDGPLWDSLIRGGNRKGWAHNSEQHEADASTKFIDINVPPNKTSAFIHYLSYKECRYFDIYGVFSDAKEVFIKRVNCYQPIDNKNRGIEHSGSSITEVPRVDRFSKIRIRGVKGAIYYMGTGFKKQIVGGSDTGFVHTDNIIGNSLKIGNWEIVDEADALRFKYKGEQHVIFHHNGPYSDTRWNNAIWTKRSGNAGATDFRDILIGRGEMDNLVKRGEMDAVKERIRQAGRNMVASAGSWGTENSRLVNGGEELKAV